MSDASIYDDLTLENIDETVSRLKFIGKIEKDEKVNVGDMYMQSVNSYTTSISRKLKGETGEKTFIFIRSVINQSFHVLSKSAKLETDYQVTLSKNIIRDLLMASRGIRNLEQTYGNDRILVAKFETLRENIAGRLHELCTIRRFKPVFSAIEEEQSQDDVESSSESIKK